jgi:PAS domain S-box-containing protein
MTTEIEDTNLYVSISPPWARIFVPLLVTAFLCGLMSYLSQTYYAHLLLKLLSILITFSSVVVAATTSAFTKNHFIVFLALASGWAVFLGSGYLIFYPGLGLLYDHIFQKGIQYELWARLLQALAFLGSCLFLRHQPRVWIINLIFGMVVLGLICLISFDNFTIPLPNAKIRMVIIALLFATIIQYWRKRALLSDYLLFTLLTSLTTFLLSEILRSFYQHPYDLFQITSEYLKLVSYWFIYGALVLTTLRQPFHTLARAASSYDSIPLPTVIVESNGTICQANLAAAKYCKKQSGMLSGLSHHTLFHNADIPQDTCPVCIRLGREQDAFTLEIPCGHNQWVECSLSPIHPFLDTRTWVEVIRNISAQKHAVHRFNEVFMASPLPMIILQSNSNKITRINKAFETWSGYSLTEFLSNDQAFKQFLGTDIPALNANWWLQFQSEQTNKEGSNLQEITIVDKQGLKHLTRVFLLIVDDDFILCFIDITQIHHQAAELHESERHFRAIIEQTLVGIFVRNQHRFLYTNPRFCEIVGRKAEELKDKALSDIVRQDAILYDLINEKWLTLQKDQGPISYTIPIIKPDGSRIILGLHATLITWDGQPASLTLVQNITEREEIREQISLYVSQLENAIKGTFYAVSRMVDFRDPYTAGHEHRVGLIAKAISQEMGWSIRRCETMELIGLVHDIGKIAVPSEILAKPSQLTPVEMELIKIHAFAGYEIMKDIYFHETPISEIIWQHHERLDGSGYPRGLKGDAIYPETRVLIIADVLEAMTSHRPYRPALDLVSAVEEIKRGRNTLYDPHVVDAAMRLIEANGFKLPCDKPC